MNKKILLSTVLAVSALTTAVSASPSIDDTKQVAKDITAQTGETPSGISSSDAPEADTVKNQKFQVKQIVIDSDVPLPQDKLNSFVTGHQNTDMTLSDLNNIASQLSTYARSNGYPAATAYLPAQSTVEGIIHLHIMGGKLGTVRIENNSVMSTKLLESYLNLKSSSVIDGNSLENELYMLNSLGKIKAHAYLKPGSEVGTSDIIIKVIDSQDKTSVVYTENYGTKSAGRYRYSFSSDLYDFSGKGDTLSIGGMISNASMHNYSLTYQIPVGTHGVRAGISASRIDYDLGGIYRQLGAKGNSDTISLFATAPLYRTIHKGLSFSFGYDYRKLNDEYTALSGVDFVKHSNLWHLGINGYQRSATNMGNLNLTLYAGNMIVDSVYENSQEYRNHTEGGFVKGVLKYNYLQRLSPQWELFYKFEAQKSSKNLSSVDDFVLGGANGVRAYPQGEGSGDEGYQTTLEFRYHTKYPGLSCSIYYDGGHVNVSKGDGLHGGQTLQGYGIGLMYAKKDDYFLRLDYARRIGLDAKASSDASANGRIWFLAGKMF